MPRSYLGTYLPAVHVDNSTVVAAWRLRKLERERCVRSRRHVKLERRAVRLDACLRDALVRR
jgi:hypothetical protein